MYAIIPLYSILQCNGGAEEWDSGTVVGQWDIVVHATQILYWCITSNSVRSLEFMCDVFLVYPNMTYALLLQSHELLHNREGGPRAQRTTRSRTRALRTNL